MEKSSDIERLEREWSPDDGFFWNIRVGVFRPEDFRRALDAVSHISEIDPLPRRLVSLLWYAPIFMEWQTERVRERGGDVVAYTAATSSMRAEIERILGVP